MPDKSAVSAADRERLRRDLISRIENLDARIGIIGLGYIGLPLATTFAERGFGVLGFDIDPGKVEKLNRGESYIQQVSADVLRRLSDEGRFRATAAAEQLAEVDAILVCVPTPLTRQREPDISAVSGSMEMIAEVLRPGQLIVLESTTYPGTTDEVVRPILEAKGLRVGEDFFLAYAPEREDPGNVQYRTATIPKVVGADDPSSRRVAEQLYAAAFAKVIPVSDTRTAEAVKLTENIFRSVNVALVNELKVIYAEMGIDIWDVIEAAKSKPFGFMPFYPGPGLGGHCIPIDPFYLTWKAREHEMSTRFIELAGEINTSMPRYVADRVAAALDAHAGRGLKDARVLIVGMAYKKNVDDTRESPALRLMELLEARGARADYHDPFVTTIPSTRRHGNLAGRQSVAITAEALKDYDAILVCTDHDDIDYAALVESGAPVIDTRNVIARLGLTASNVVKA